MVVITLGTYKFVIPQPKRGGGPRHTSSAQTQFPIWFVKEDALPHQAKSLFAHANAACPTLAPSVAHLKSKSDLESFRGGGKTRKAAPKSRDPHNIPADVAAESPFTPVASFESNNDLDVKLPGVGVASCPRHDGSSRCGANHHHLHDDLHLKLNLGLV